MDEARVRILGSLTEKIAVFFSSSQKFPSGRQDLEAVWQAVEIEIVAISGCS